MSRIDDRWPEIDTILSDALQMPRADRAGYVARVCGDDVELRNVVMRILARSTSDGAAAHDGPLWDELAVDLAEGVVSPPAAGDIEHSTPVTAAQPARQGTVIDRYRILEEIGRGGMSVVYRAERTDGAFDAPVALKISTLGAIDPRARARFERERHILADLRHPSIAQILDGGESESGHPYLVMELVDGAPIDEHADRERLTIDQRLALFVEVAHAVQHAHRNLVVHRDIKPSNVLVDREGRVKLLDFGIAALVEEDAQVTRTHHRALTPAFASPEQLKGEAVTTVSDVYQLGHLLYGLLTGCPPYRPETSDTDAWRRAVTETEPVRPSELVVREQLRERLAPEGSAIEEIARRRRSTPRRLSRDLRGDLETIALMALRKEPDRRYPSALQLADDVARFRQGLPILAQPDTAAYRLRKFVARNRGGVAVGVTVALSFLVFVVTLVVQARVIASERDRARVEAETAEGVTSFLLDIFQDSAPVSGATVDVRALDVVDRAAERVETDLTDRPIVRARVMAAIGTLYNRFGSEERGRPLLREAVAVLAGDREQNAVPWAFAVSELATLEIEDGYTPEEVASLREVVDVYEQEFGRGSLEWIGAKTQLATGMLWTGDFAGARAVHDEAIVAFEAYEPEPSDEWLSMVTTITTVLGARGNLDRSLRLLEAAYPLATERDHSLVLYGVTGQLAEIYDARDEVELLDRFAREHLAHAERTFGPDNSQCGTAWTLIGEAEHAQGHYEASERAFERMKELSRDEAALGQNAANTLPVIELLIDDGRAAEAIDAAEAAVDTLAGLFGYDTSLTGGARLLRARAWLDVGRVADADSALHALDTYHVATGRGPRGHAEALETLARLHLVEGNPDSAVTTAARAVDILKERSPRFWKLARMRGVYGRALLATGDRDGARRALEAAREGLSGRGDRYEREVLDALASLDG